ncbi:hypothetical protein TNCV_2316571 [Trichonephila clavipes]|nr:hypothetical protein TNCV_2316571 [Trichonephila clavipes]
MLSLRGRTPCELPRLPKEPRHRIAEEKERKKNEKKNTYITPEPPKVNFWEQRAKTAAQRQQSTSTNQQKPPTTTTSHRNKAITRKPSLIYLKNSRTPAVQETFELLEEFIKIATTIPTRFGRLRAINQLCKNEINI